MQDAVSKRMGRRAHLPGLQEVRELAPRLNARRSRAALSKTRVVPPGQRGNTHTSKQGDPDGARLEHSSDMAPEGKSTNGILRNIIKKRPGRACPPETENRLIAQRPGIASHTGRASLPQPDGKSARELHPIHCPGAGGSRFRPDDRRRKLLPARGALFSKHGRPITAGTDRPA